MHKYKLHEDDALTGQSGFSEFITQKKTRRRAGKPLLLGRTWKVSSDPFRRELHYTVCISDHSLTVLAGISKCAVGLDIMKRYRCNDQPQNSDIKLRPSRVTGLMGFDESDAPVLHSNVFAQRTSMYIQYSQTEVQTPIDTQASLHADHVSHLQEIASLYDNGNTIIIFDNSDSGSINDTVIEARGEWEMRWRKMSFYLPVALKSAPDDEIFAGECMRTITADFFKAVGHTWDDLLDASWEVCCASPRSGGAGTDGRIHSMFRSWRTRYTSTLRTRVAHQSCGVIRPSGSFMRS